MEATAAAALLKWQQQMFIRDVAKGRGRVASEMAAFAQNWHSTQSIKKVIQLMRANAVLCNKLRRFVKRSLCYALWQGYRGLQQHLHQKAAADHVMQFAKGDF